MFGQLSLIRRRIVTSGLLLLVVSAAPAAASGDKGKKAQPKPPVNLVWPLPPDEPRIRFVQEIRGASDIEPLPKTGTLDRVVGRKKEAFRPRLKRPFSVATDSKQRVYVADSAQAMVFVFDREKHQVSYIGRQEQVPLRQPLGIAVDDKDRVWVADAGLQRVLAYDSQWQQRAVIGRPGELVNPVSLAVDTARKRLYVADSKLHCVVVYDTETAIRIATLGKRGEGPGEFNFPTGVSVARQGKIYVADTLNFRIQIFGPDLKFADSLGTKGDNWGQFLKPKGVALDSYQNIYVTDSDFNNLQIFDSQKRLLLFLGAFGNQPGQFMNPAGIHLDGENLIYVADQLNHRIQIFRLINGETTDQPPALSSKTKEGDQTAQAPSGPKQQ